MSKAAEFFEKASSDPALSAELKGIYERSLHDTIALGKKAGFDLTEADFTLPQGQLNDNVLSSVSGGMTGMDGTAALLFGLERKPV
jgi:predicted ribosomally synthesized peptide with nif11-like leader